MGDGSGTMRIEIRYLSVLSDRTGRRREQVSLAPGATLRQVADWLDERYGFSLPDPGIVATLNGHGWAQLPAHLATTLHEGDVICLFPPPSGG